MGGSMCRECRKVPVDGEDRVCDGCLPTVRARRRPPEETLAMIDDVLRGSGT